MLKENSKTKEGLKMNDFTMKPIQKGQPYPSDNYLKMLKDTKISPSSITHHTELFQTILRAIDVEFVIEGRELSLVSDEKKLTNFGIVVSEVKQIYELDGEQQEVELPIFSHLATPKIVRVNLLDLNSNRWLDKLGVNYMFKRGSAEKIKEMIKTLARFAPVVEEYHYSGWALNKENTYIMGGEKLHGTAISNDDSKSACEYALKMLDVAERRLTIPLLAIASLSLVQSRMISCGEFFKGVVGLLAQSQSFKTTITALFFDFENGRKADINFDSTESALTRIIGQKRDSVCIVDDLKPASTANMKKNLLSKIEKIIRMCADDSNGFQRAGQKNAIISNKANGLVVITAEEIPINVYSTLARLLILEMNRKSVNKEKLTYFQANHGIYRAFIKNYIRFISAQGVTEYCANLKNRFLEERSTLHSKLIAHNIQVDPRTNDMTVWLSISFSEFLKYALKVGAVAPDQLATLTKEAEKIFIDLMVQQAERINELDDITRFFKGLRVLLDTKEARIEHLEARNSGYLSADSKSAIGFMKKGYVFLKNDVAYQHVAAYYRQNGKEFAIAESTLRRLLYDNGYLITKNQKSVIHRLYVNRETYQCIKFSEATFNWLKGGKNDGTEDDSEIPDNWGMRQNANNILGRRD